MLATVDKCCWSWCYFRNTWEDKPCWGEVTVIDQEIWDDNYDWIHACEGHENGWNGPYVPMPSDSEVES